MNFHQVLELGLLASFQRRPAKFALNCPPEYCLALLGCHPAITGVSSSYSSPVSRSVIINTKSPKFKYKRHQASISKEKEKNQYVVTKNISCLPEQDPNQAQ